MWIFEQTATFASYNINRLVFFNRGGKCSLRGTEWVLIKTDTFFFRWLNSTFHLLAIHLCLYYPHQLLCFLSSSSSTPPLPLSLLKSSSPPPPLPRLRYMSLQRHVADPSWTISPHSWSPRLRLPESYTFRSRHVYCSVQTHELRFCCVFIHKLHSMPKLTKRFRLNVIRLILKVRNR